MTGNTKQLCERGVNGSSAMLSASYVAISVVQGDYKGTDKGGKHDVAIVFHTHSIAESFPFFCPHSIAGI